MGEAMGDGEVGERGWRWLEVAGAGRKGRWWALFLW